jgi:hypothetical protein
MLMFVARSYFTTKVKHSAVVVNSIVVRELNNNHFDFPAVLWESIFFTNIVLIYIIPSIPGSLS